MDSRRKIVLTLALATTALAAIQGIKGYNFGAQFASTDEMGPQEYGHYYLVLGIGALCAAISLILWILLIRSKNEEADS